MSSPATQIMKFPTTVLKIATPTPDLLAVATASSTATTVHPIMIQVQTRAAFVTAPLASAITLTSDSPYRQPLTQLRRTPFLSSDGVLHPHAHKGERSEPSARP